MDKASPTEDALMVSCPLKFGPSMTPMDIGELGSAAFIGEG